MYPYDFRSVRKGINHNEVFIVMPFSAKLESVYTNLIVPAVSKTNELLERTGQNILQAYRSKDDIRTASGWINVLEHLTTAQIVLGVLTEDNANVFYEIGIAHATQPITRQVLIAEKGYEPQFDIKDLIYYPYDSDLLKSIEPLALKIKDAIDWYKIAEEKKIRQAIMQLGPYEFEIIMFHNGKRNFVLHTGKQQRDLYENEIRRTHGDDYAKGAFERHVPAISNLCRIGLLGLDTHAESIQGKPIVNIQFSYHWTDLGNNVLLALKLLGPEEVVARKNGLPRYFL